MSTRCWFPTPQLASGSLPFYPDAKGSSPVAHHKTRESYSFILLLQDFSAFAAAPKSRYYDPPMQYCSRNSTPIQFRIASDMCIKGSCGKFGRCYQFFSGGNMFSTCTCFAGYRGWGCTDESEAVSEIDLLAATLLLCLSNLLYLPAVGLAIYRGFYTESFVYFANMIASTVSKILVAYCSCQTFISL